MADYASAILILQESWAQFQPIVCEIHASVVTFLKQSDALVVVLAIAVLFALYAFVGSLFTGDTSFVDRQWSVVPLVYAFTLAYLGNWNARNTLMFAVVLVWGVRLSYNFWRKGGYSGEEDYRWAILRKHPILGNKIVWFLFNVSFICTVQHVLLLWITLPAYIALLHSADVQTVAQLNALDFAAAGLFLFFLAVETVADQQQWVFQNEKYRRRDLVAKNADATRTLIVGDYARGFLTSGLFKYSRHPNFFSEQAIWISFYLFSVAATGYQWNNWSALGALALIMLFQGSTTFTEQISVSKYPAYREYQKTTSRLIPWFAGRKLKDS
eukprot:ANDGO_04810.mRNA.1 Uncharacterized protein C594.04c